MIQLLLRQESVDLTVLVPERDKCTGTSRRSSWLLYFVNKKVCTTL